MKPQSSAKSINATFTLFFQPPIELHLKIWRHAFSLFLWVVEVEPSSLPTFYIFEPQVAPWYTKIQL
jgi:hypothetical protein